MRALAQFVILGRWWVIGAAVVFLPLAAVIRGDVASRLSVGGFEDPGSESAQAADILDEEFQQGAPDFVVLITTGEGGDIDAPDVTEAGTALTEDLTAETTVLGTVGNWDEDLPQNSELPEGGISPLSSDEGSQALIIARLADDEDEAIGAADELSEVHDRRWPDIDRDHQGFRGGSPGQRAGREGSPAVRTDHGTITFIALVVVFRRSSPGCSRWRSACSPSLEIFVVLTLLTTRVTDVSVFALNLTMGLGLGLTIDYSLFIVSRYREELAAGLPMEVALSRTMQTQRAARSPSVRPGHRSPCWPCWSSRSSTCAPSPCQASR